MSLRASAWHPWSLFLKGGLQQFLMFYAFEGSCMASLSLVCLRMPATIPYVFMSLRASAWHPWSLCLTGGLQQFLMFHVFESFCMASLELVFKRSLKALVWHPWALFFKGGVQQFLVVVWLWKLMHAPLNIFLGACDNALFVMPLKAHACIPDPCFLKEACSNSLFLYDFESSCTHPLYQDSWGESPCEIHWVLAWSSWWFMTSLALDDFLKKCISSTRQPQNQQKRLKS